MLGPGKKTLPKRSSPPSVETGLCCVCFGSSCKVFVGKLEQFFYRLKQKCEKWICEVSAASGCRGWDVSVCLVVWAKMLGGESCSHLFLRCCNSLPRSLPLPHPSPRKTQKFKTITPASAWLLPGHLCHSWEILFWVEHVCINSHSFGSAVCSCQTISAILHLSLPCVGRAPFELN